jgi:hypothetical protein
MGAQQKRAARLGAALGPRVLWSWVSLHPMARLGLLFDEKSQFQHPPPQLLPARVELFPEILWPVRTIGRDLLLNPSIRRKASSISRNGLRFCGIHLSVWLHLRCFPFSFERGRRLGAPLVLWSLGLLLTSRRLGRRRRLKQTGMVLQHPLRTPTLLFKFGGEICQGPCNE